MCDRTTFILDILLFIFTLGYCDAALIDTAANQEEKPYTGGHPASLARCIQAEGHAD